MNSLPQPLEYSIASEIDPAFALRARFILETVQKKKPLTILDAGCGRGFYTRAFTFFPFLKTITGIDLKKEYLDKAEKEVKDKRVKLLEASIYALPFKNETFDFAVSSEVMEHLPDDVAALKELKRVVKKGGTLIISVPHRSFPFLWDPLNWILMKFFNTHVPKDIWWLAGIWADHERLYTMEEITSVAKKAGWKVKKTQSVIHYAWPLSHFLLYGIGKNIVEGLGAKEFSRFSFQRKPFSEWLSKLVAYPSTFDPNDMTGKSSVDLIIELEKH